MASAPWLQLLFSTHTVQLLGWDTKMYKREDNISHTSTQQQQTNTSTRSTDTETETETDTETEDTNKRQCRQGGKRDTRQERGLGYWGHSFPRQVCFSPDGMSMLASSEDACVHVYTLPEETTLFGEIRVGEDDDTREEDERRMCDPKRRRTKPQELEPTVTISEGESISSVDWMPSSGRSAFATATRGRPLHLWDAHDARLLASYCIHDRNDEPTSALCVRFDRSAHGAGSSRRLIAGLDTRLVAFDVERPGRDALDDASTYDAVGKEGQRGLISCIDSCATGSGLVAAGSFARSIGIYDLYARLSAQLVIHNAHAGGITHVQFSRCGNFIYSCARKDAGICCWDLRNASQSVYTLERPAGDTNQRMGFDIEACGRHLIGGTPHGCARAYDLRTGERVGEWRVHERRCCVGDVSIHGRLPVVATASGERHFPLETITDIDVDSDSDSDSDDVDDDDDDSDASGNDGDGSGRAVNGKVSLWLHDYVYGELPPEIALDTHT